MAKRQRGADLLDLDRYGTAGMTPEEKRRYARRTAVIRDVLLSLGAPGGKPSASPYELPHRVRMPRRGASPD